MIKIFHLQVDLTKDHILKSILIFAIPILISNIFQQLYNTADTMIVGNYLGDTSLAAIGASSAIYDLLVGFSLGVGNGFSIVAARHFGAKNDELLKQSVAGALIIGGLFTALMMILGFIGVYPLLTLLNTPVHIIEEAYSYIYIIILFIGIMFAYNLFAGLLRAIGNSFIPLIFLILSSLINILLDYLFIAQFHSGIQGAAIATVIAEGISCLLCLLYIYFKVPQLIPERQHFHFQKNLYQELLGQGFSMGFMMAIVSSGTVILQKAINHFGFLTIAGHTTARKINAFCMMPATTLSTSLATFVSQNRGANQRQRIKDGVKICFQILFVWAMLISIIMYFGAKPLVEIISGSSQLEVINTGSKYLILNAPFHFILGVLLILRNALQGLGMKIVPLISSVIEFVGKIIFATFFIGYLGYFGVIICEPVIWCMMCIQLLYSFYNNSYIKMSQSEDDFEVA